MEEELRNKLMKQERAKALCPIRTRYLPEYEKQKTKQMNRTVGTETKGKKKPVLAITDALVKLESSDSIADYQVASQKSFLSSSTLGSLASAARGANPAARLAKKAKRAVRKVAKTLVAEKNAVKDAAGEFTSTAWDDMKKGGHGADRITSEIVGRAYHRDHDDLEAFRCRWLAVESGASGQGF